MRCLALAQQWRDRGGAVALTTRCEIPALLERYRAEGCEVHSLQRDGGEWEWLKPAQSDDWMALDGYGFDEVDQRRCRAAGYKLLVIDDMARLPHYSAEIILNQNLHAERLTYDSDARRVLRGPRYALLRREFLRRAGSEFSVRDTVRRVLVSFGGTDPAALGAKTAEAAAEAGDWEVVLVSGSTSARSVSHPRVRVFSNVTDMAELMADVDVAIAASGTTSWELAYLALPSILVAVAENQRPLAAELSARGAAISVSDAAESAAARIAEALRRLAADASARRRMSEAAAALVDGAGVERVVATMLDEAVCLRRARPHDCRRWWEWANEPAVRQVSFSSAAIPWEDHRRWFQRKLADASVLMFVAEAEGEPVGQLRYELNGREAVVSIALDASLRGRGLGTQVLSAGSGRLRAGGSIDRIHAYIKPGNDTSVQAFAKSGYRRVTDAVISNQTAVHMVQDLAS